jgi:hypothetical protein
MSGQNTEVRREQRDTPMQTRLAPVSTVNAESRTVDLTWTTGARVRRYDWWNDRYYQEELSLDPAHVRMERLQSGAANLLDSHSRWSLSNVLGVVSSAELQGDRGIATVRFSQREDVEPIFKDVQDGIIRNISVGYTVHKIERIAPGTEGGDWVYRIVDWEPYELSLVTVPADAGSTTRSAQGAPGRPDTRDLPTSLCEYRDLQVQAPAAAGIQTRKEDTMSATTTPAATTPAATPDELAQARAEGARLEGERQAGIREAVRLGGLGDAYADQLIANREMTPADAGLAVLREKAKRSAATPTRSAADIRVVGEEVETRRQAIADAIALRANPNAEVRRDKARMDAARQYRGQNLIDMARDAIEAAGGNTRGFSRREIAVMALNLDRDMQVRGGMQSTSDFPAILAGTVNRTLRAAYDLQVRTFVGWARESTAPDFREIARTQLSEAAVFKKIKEGGEYKAISFGDSAEKYSLSKFGGIVSITWESLVNDDLSAFDRIPTALAAEAAAIEGDIVYGILTGSSVMSDGVELFHADHGNVVAGTVISDTALGAGRAAMRKQKGMKGRVLNLTPSYLIVGPDKEVEANKFTSAAFVAAKASDINPNFNTSLEVVVEARIQGNNWFLSAAPQLVDTVEYSYLEGEQGLYTEQRQGFEVDGLQIKARHTFAAKAIDWRGMFKNPGA